MYKLNNVRIKEQKNIGYFNYYTLTDVSLNEEEKHLVLFALNHLATMFEEGNIKEEDFKEIGYPHIDLSSIYELRNRIEAEII